MQYWHIYYSWNKILVMEMFAALTRQVELVERTRIHWKVSLRESFGFLTIM
jgi:hypothetical protein